MANVLNSRTDGSDPDNSTGGNRAATVPTEPDGSAGSAPLLREPRDGLPAVVDDEAGLARTVEAFSQGSGPVAVDAERASGYRYSQRAYLVQLRREDAGSALIDPVACPDLAGLGRALAGVEMVLHAAHQDLPCLAEVGLRPARLFDTELAGRLLGYQRVGLAIMVERILGVRLAKEHSAVDWSVRPLPADWLRYAALDVEVLVELRDKLAEELAAAGKLDWALEEFAAVLAAPPKEPRTDPWRRTSGIHRVRTQQGLAVVRELWWERDRIARERDIAPGRLLSDAALVAAALAMPSSQAELAGLKPFGVRLARRYVPQWYRAVERVRAMAAVELPQPSAPGEGPPPTNRWADRDPAAARRLEAVRAVLNEIAGRIIMPLENLLQPDAVRRLAWSPPKTPDEESVAAHLRGNQAREWQIGLTAASLATALRQAGER